MRIALNADLEHRIVVKVESGRYGSPAEVIQASLELLEARDAALAGDPGQGGRPVWETVAALGQEISEAEWGQVPSDLAQDVDRHLYKR
jgi:Arc/MetJ-type ribon-helix-helix transcriptional regulator